MNQIRMINIENISAPPCDRSDFYEEHIINKIRKDIEENGNLDLSHAIIVREIGNNQYQIVNGNLRYILAKKIGIEKLPCIVKNISETDGIYEFLSENTQHELTPLVVGLAGLLIENGLGGRGNVSDRTRLCRCTGIDKGSLSKYISAATIYKHVENNLNCDEKRSLARKCSVLCKIKNFPNETWFSFAKYIANNTDAEKLTKSINLVKTVESIENNQVWRDCFFPFSKMVEMSLKDQTGEMTIKPTFRELNKTVEVLMESGRGDEINDLKQWLNENAFRVQGGRTFFNFRQIINHCRDILNVNNHTDKNFVNCDAIEFVKSLADESVTACISDPPFGINFHDIGISNTSPIVNDIPEQAMKLYENLAKNLYAKMKKNSYVVVFYSPKFIVPVVTAFVNAQFTLSDQMTWVKNGHGQGNLISSPLNKCEHFFIFKKGNPVWLTGAYNCFVYPVPSNRLHPMQKPIEMIESIVDAVSSPNDLIIDPFCGSGTILKACLNKNRLIAGAEIDENFYNTAYCNLFCDDESNVAVAI
ncbi:ParB N-terminal domain-containing protein [Desulfovibrio aerotolerans]|uniref:site-specific DNA-methyltransferase (adenine-specific) n=1 Tax=Solidesulfovibrio aerotolerans TaxID=295255 RepID=A0A7C9IJX6_9BACT|nr:DNA modification methylase [Solidesulfovibrio aerotolerans]MYL82461.1 ParB N-terminal domain-containing protein [Solidesulfovibrio aerotolerans]